LIAASAAVLLAVLIFVGIEVFQSPTHASAPPRPKPPSKLAVKSKPKPKPAPISSIKVIKHVSYGSSPDQYMDVFLPSKITRPPPIVMFVHGGSFVRGGTQSLYPEASAVARAGWVGVSVNYRLDGYPNESDDVLAAAAWMHAHGAKYHVNPKKIALFGTSAGGNLVALAATLAHKQHRNVGIVAVVSWSGPMDLVSFAHKIAGNSSYSGVIAAGNSYLGCSLASCPSVWAAASPINHVSPGDPPMYLANSADELIPYDQATSMMRKLRSLGDRVQLFKIAGSKHALQYASQAFQPSITWLVHYLSPLRGALPTVPNESSVGAG
jgi:acetyl esterase/lipase